ncbi:hypothetical protein WG68_02145 [Arsukibacterium ikkense]|uniref:Uncharacterized protein n=1 Tax=Arsukibacterium ikkense TaxID=336831 RepID=A0A0M2V842_9GAMM|nr:hypothetical protein WG68_02145 [Arsukibacterium ikkense]
MSAALTRRLTLSGYLALNYGVAAACQALPINWYLLVFESKMTCFALFCINDFMAKALYTGRSLLLILWRMLWLALL